MKTLITIAVLIGLSINVFAQNFGQKTHPMNSSVSDLEIIKYWNNIPESDIELFNVAHSIFSEKAKNGSYADILASKEYQKLIKENNKLLLGGPLLGNVSSQNISIWLRTSNPSKVQIELINGKHSESSKVIETIADNDLTAVFNFDKLKPATTYMYSVIVNGKKIDKPEYHFTTPVNSESTESTRISFGSCPHRWGLGNDKLWNTIQSRKPNAMLLLGDIAVQDRTNEIGMHRADYLLRDLHTPWSSFVANIPVYANWDDHDYFANDKSGVPKGFTDADRKNVREIFMNSWANPFYGLKDEGIYFKTQIGCAEVVMTDNRYFREDEKGVFLGETQMEWLKNQVKNCKSPFLILSCGSMWSDFVSKGKDSWGTVDPKGREEIFDLIEKNNISAVLLISGDRHGARGFKIDRKSGFELYEFEMASLGARVGPPKSKPEWKTQLYGIDGTFAFGEFTFTNTTKEKQVVFRMINDNGEVLYEKTLTHNELTKK